MQFHKRELLVGNISHGMDFGRSDVGIPKALHQTLDLDGFRIVESHVLNAESSQLQRHLASNGTSANDDGMTFR